MEVLDSRATAAIRLVDAYGEQAAPQAAVYVTQAVEAGRERDALYWDQVRRIVEDLGRRHMATWLDTQI